MSHGLGFFVESHPKFVSRTRRRTRGTEEPAFGYVSLIDDPPATTQSAPGPHLLPCILILPSSSKWSSSAPSPTIRHSRAAAFPYPSFRRHEGRSTGTSLPWFVGDYILAYVSEY